MAEIIGLFPGIRPVTAARVELMVEAIESFGDTSFTTKDVWTRAGSVTGRWNVAYLAVCELFDHGLIELVEIRDDGSYVYRSAQVTEGEVA